MPYFDLCIISSIFGAVLALGFLSWRFRRARHVLGMFEEASNLSAVGVALFDHRDRFVMANRLVHEYLPDFHSDILAGSDLKAVMDYMYDHAVDYDEGLMGALYQSVDDAGGLGFREVVMGANGSHFLVEARKISGGCTAVSMSNISKTKRREEYVQRLSRFNHELYEAVEAATTGIVVVSACDSVHQIIFANKELNRIFDASGDDMLCRTLPDLFANVDGLDMDGDLLETLITPQAMDTEICFQCKGDGSVKRYCDFKLTPVESADKSSQLFIGVFTDTTALKGREQELSKSQKLEALGQMAAGVSHDFNNILSIVDGYARLISTELDEGHPLLDHVGRIRKAAKRGTGLVNHMLTFSRHKITSTSVVDLNVSIKEQKMLLVPLLDARIELNMMLEPQPIFVEGSNDDFSQILMNLVVNARDAMPLGGWINIQTAICHTDAMSARARDKLDSGDYACLRVQDNGEGIDPVVVEKMFDPFFTTKEQGSGTGLGLSIVYGLVKKMGGVIDVETALGKGVDISIYLPLSDKRLSKNVVGTPDDLESFRLEGYTVLLAEDEDDLRLLVAEMLKKLGANVLCAQDGNEALWVQDEYEGEVDLLLSDVVMPDLGGIELSELLVSLRPDVKTIFMSGYPAHGNNARVSIPDDAFFLAKPIRYEDLVLLIYQCVNGEVPTSSSSARRWHSDVNGEETKGERI